MAVEIIFFVLPGKKKVKENLRIRHENYNRQWGIVKKLEEEGKALVLRPSADYNVTRYTHDKDLLSRWMQLGYDDTKARIEEIRKFMEE